MPMTVATYLAKYMLIVNSVSRVLRMRAWSWGSHIERGVQLYTPPIDRPDPGAIGIRALLKVREIRL